MTAERTKLKARIASNWICAKSMSRKDLEVERKLHQSKWFDYRFISPMEATHQFRAEYSKIYRLKYARNIDTEEAEKRTGVRAGRGLQNKTELTSFWRARQAADALGLPYRLFLDVAFEKLIRSGWKRFPHINQIYSGKVLERIYVALAAHWEEYQEANFNRSFSQLPEYRTESYHAFPAQTAHRAWVVELLKKWRRATAIGDACFVARVLPPELALTVFDEELVARAREEAMEATPAPSEPCGLPELLPCALAKVAA